MHQVSDWWASGDLPSRQSVGLLKARDAAASAADAGISGDLRASLKDRRRRPGHRSTYTCIPDGMPRAVNVIFPMEIVIQPHVTHIMIEYLSMLRRIYTDGRSWSENLEPSFMGYSIGQWRDEDGDGRYDALVIETRNLKGPRSFDETSRCMRTTKPSSRSAISAGPTGHPTTKSPPAIDQR
jgi:hypothetical protein